MSNPIRDAVADFTIGQIVAPSAPTPTVDSPRINIDYRQYPFAYGSSDTSSTSVAAKYYGDSPYSAYTGPINVTGMTQSVADQFVGMPKGVGVGISGTGLGTFAGLGAAASMMNLERIEKKIAAGEEGYGLAMFNGRIVGVSPGIFGDDSFVFSGVLPEGLTHKQRVELRDAIMATNAPATSDDGFENTLPTPEPTQEELASSATSNIVYDDKGSPVTVGGTGPDAGNFVTTESGQYVSQDDLQQQNTAYQNTQSDDNGDNNNTGTQYSFSDLVPDEDDDFIDNTPIPSDDNDTEPGDSGCCFIMLEARYGDGTMDDVVRRYRDEHMTDRNKRGYYKVAEVLVPLMRKSRLAKWLVTKTFADPLVSYGKYYYGQNKHGVIFAPVKSFWMSVFNIVGGETEFIRENGKVV